MTLALIITGTVFLLIGAGFFWLNNNSPIQTRIPLFTLPVGAIALLLGLGRMIG